MVDGGVQADGGNTGGRREGELMETRCRKTTGLGKERTFCGMAVKEGGEGNGRRRKKRRARGWRVQCDIHAKIDGREWRRKVGEDGEKFGRGRSRGGGRDTIRGNIKRRETDSAVRRGEQE